MGELFANFKGYDWQATRAEGRKEGRTEGFDLLGELVTLLMNEQRYDDVKKAASDREYRQELIKEMLPDKWAQFNDEPVKNV